MNIIKRSIGWSTLVALFLVTVSAIYAESPGRRRDGNVIRDRQVNQARRVRHGVRNGELTRSETRDIVRQERDIQAKRREMKADGEFSRDERREIHRDLNETSRDIYREKHDRQDRPNGGDGNADPNRNFSIDAREERQKDRIRQGVRSGELTAREAEELAREQRRIRQLEDDLRKDGLSVEERARLQRELNEANRNIYQEKHDEQDRPKADDGNRDPNRPRSIDAREERQKERIRQGVQSGELTRREAAKLAEEQARIRRLENRLKEDGLTVEERARLQKELNEASENISKQKHDEQDRN